MTSEELINYNISAYTNIIRIEEAEDRDKEIQRQKRELRIKLASLGVPLDRLDSEQ